MDDDRDHCSYRNLLGAIALGAGTPEERRTWEAHLAGCAACRAEVSRLRVAVQALPLALEDREPARALRDRIEAAALREPAGPELRESRRERPRSILPPPAEGSRTPTPATRVRIPRHYATPWAAAAALLLVFSLGMLLWNVQLQRDLRREEQPAAVALRLAQPLIGGGGRMVYPGEREVMVVTVRGLPSLSPGLIYELWPVRGDAPTPTTPTARRWADPALGVESG